MTSEESSFPQDFTSFYIETCRIHYELGWTRSDIKNDLIKNYGVTHRYQLTDEQREHYLKHFRHLLAQKKNF